MVQVVVESTWQTLGRILWFLIGWFLLILVPLLLIGTVAYAQQVPTCSLTAAPTSGTGATDVTLTWSAQHAQTCVASGAWSGPKDCAGGSQVRNDILQTSTFTLKVTAATGKVVARWDKITQNQDGSPAVISGYKLYLADAASGLPSATALALPASPTEYTFWRSPGPVSAGIKSVRSDGVDSTLSNVASKTVVAASGTCSATVTIAPRPKAPSLTLTLSKLVEFFNPPKPAKTNGS